MKTISVKKLLIFVLIFSASACVWEEPGRHDHGHDGRGDSHHRHEHGDRDDDGRRGDDDWRRDDSRSESRYSL